jgi:hypothetical protein
MAAVTLLCGRKDLLCGSRGVELLQGPGRQSLKVIFSEKFIVWLLCGLCVRVLGRDSAFAAEALKAKAKKVISTGCKDGAGGDVAVDRFSRELSSWFGSRGRCSLTVAALLRGEGREIM